MLAWDALPAKPVRERRNLMQKDRRESIGLWSNAGSLSHTAGTGGAGRYPLAQGDPSSGAAIRADRNGTAMPRACKIAAARSAS